MTLSRRDFIASSAALIATAGFPGGRALADDVQDGLARFLDQVRVKYQLPGLAVRVQARGRVEHDIAIGIRARGANAEVGAQDLWHLGSCAKAMTATLLARQVERGLLSWDSTVATVLPDIAASMHPACARITLDQLLTMSAGLAENPSNHLGLDQTVAALRTLDASSLPLSHRRLQVAAQMLAEPPHDRPGTRAAYSNTGYIIAGVIAETVGGKPYEQLIAEQVFAPLGMNHFGFGAPGSSTEVDQPRGHKDGRNSPALVPSDPEADLPSVFRPAGGLHMGLADWGLFVSDVLDGIKGRGRLLEPATYRLLLASTHLKPLAVYAHGWAVLEKDGVPMALAHTGSNARWFTSVNAYPQQETFFLLATNDGRQSAVDKAFAEIRSRLKSDYGVA